LQQQCKTPKTKTTKSPACTTKYAPNCIQALTPISRRQQKGGGKNVKKKKWKTQTRNRARKPKANRKWKCVRRPSKACTWHQFLYFKPRAAYHLSRENNAKPMQNARLHKAHTELQKTANQKTKKKKQNQRDFPRKTQNAKRKTRGYPV